MKKTITLLSIFLGITTVASAQCGSGRYATSVFPTVTTTSNITYGSNNSFSGSVTSLKLDFYEPAGDTASVRPLIIFAHGGSFLGGSKTDLDVATLSREFAKKGYVCASIDYRLGFFPIDSANAVKAVIRGVQDMKAAIRFFHMDRETGTNAYKIDTNNIFIGGSSAGALMAVHTYYLDRTCEINNYIAPAALATLGGIEGNSGNPCFSTKVNGVINLCGALAQYGWLEAGDLPLCSIHGTNDATVKYNRGIVAPGGVQLMYLDGSRMLHEQAQAVGVQSNFYTFLGAPHVPYFGSDATSVAYMDTTINFVRDYLVDRLGCTETPLQLANTPAETANLYSFTTCSGNVAPTFCDGTGINETKGDLKLNVFPNPSNGDVTITLGNGSSMSIQLIDFAGRTLLSENTNSSSYTLQRGSLINGMYLLRITNENGVSSTETVVFK